MTAVVVGLVVGWAVRQVVILIAWYDGLRKRGMV